MIDRKVITIAIAGLFLVGCANNKSIPDYRNLPKEEKLVVAVNDSMCLKESGIKTNDSTAIRHTAQKFMEFLIDKDYKKLKPYLLPQLDKTLAKKDFANQKFNIFFKDANDILKNFQNYKITSLFMIVTNPKSVLLKGFCREGGDDPSKNVFFNFSDPTEESAAILITGQQGKKKMNAVVLLNKYQNEWKIGFMNVYPGGAVGKTTYEIYQLAAQANQEDKKELAYLYNKLILSLTPKDPLMPEYMVNTYKSMEDLAKVNVNLPQMELNKGQKWLIGPNNQIIVYDVSLSPSDDKMSLLITYLPITTDPAQIDVDAPLIAQYLKTNYPDLAFNFSNVLLQTIIPGQDPNLPPNRKEININAQTK